MKAAKRVLAIALAMILALAVFAFPASAFEDGAMEFEINTAEETYAAGDSVTVNVFVSSDFNATCMRIPVLYSKDVFELPAGNDVRIQAYGTCLEKKNSLDVNTDMSDTPIDLYNVTDVYDSSSYGIVAIQWTASITSSAINSFYSEAKVKCFSFQLKVKSDASGVGTILIPAAEELKPAFQFYNQTVTDPTDALTITRVNATFTVDSWSIEVAEGSQDDITTFPDSQVIIDRENKILKNWDTEVTTTKAVIQANVTTVGNATLTYKANTSAGAYGTGAKVRLFAGADMAWIADYSVLIYGDVDGNGSVRAADASLVSRYCVGLVEITDEDVYNMAADVDCSGAIRAADASAISRYCVGIAEIDQSR